MAIIAEALKNDSYWPKNHFLPIITPKPAYIYPNNFWRENFSKKLFGPMGPPWGTWGPYLGIPSVEYFPNVFFVPPEPPGPPHAFKYNGGLQKNFKKSKGLSNVVLAHCCDIALNSLGINRSQCHSLSGKDY